MESNRFNLKKRSKSPRRIRDRTSRVLSIQNEQAQYRALRPELTVGFLRINLVEMLQLAMK